MNEKGQTNKSFVGGLVAIFGIYLLWVAFNVFQAQDPKNIADANFFVPSVLGAVLLIVGYKMLS